MNYGPGNANLQSKIFFIWFGCCFLCIAFVYFLIYETKGLTLEQIDEMYDEVKVARKSVHWLPSNPFTAQRASTAGRGGVGPGNSKVGDTDERFEKEGIENMHGEHGNTT